MHFCLKMFDDVLGIDLQITFISLLFQHNKITAIEIAEGEPPRSNLPMFRGLKMRVGRWVGE